MWVEYNYSSVELERMSKQPTHTFLTCVVRSGGRGGRTKEQTPSPLLGNLNKNRVSTHTSDPRYIFLLVTMTTTLFHMGKMWNISPFTDVGGPPDGISVSSIFEVAH